MRLPRLARPIAFCAAVALCIAATSAPTQASTPVRHFRASDDLHIQYAGALVVPHSTRVLDLDSDATSAATVKHLHALSKVVVCYISAGSVESYRSDASKFPKGVVGKVLDGWPDERWLDIRQTAVLLPIMKARVARCRAKGFDAMDFDNVDAYTNDTGFNLSATDQLRYNRDLAALAHAAGMRAVLKNATSLTTDLVSSFDAAVNEQCGEYSECGVYAPFIRAHKPVWVIEYSRTHAQACAESATYHLHVQRKHLNLDAWRDACPAPRG